MLADLHGMEFGPDNRKLLEAIHRYRPDGILIAGDMIVRNDSASLKTASSLLRSLDTMQKGCGERIAIVTPIQHYCGKSTKTRL